VAGITISLAFCVLLLVASKRKVMAGRQHHRPRLGRGPARDEQPAAALVDVAVRAHRGVCRVYLALYPGLGTNPGTLKWSSTGQWEAEQEKALWLAMAPVYAKYTAMPAEPWPRTRRPWASASACSSTTAPVPWL
jgi:cytochrome c oxidase cbb3-type subunit 3